MSQHRSYRLVFTATALVSLFAQGSALAGGLEKATNWSGRYGGVADAGTSIVTGAESIYFNPAGLGAGDGSQVSANFAPTITQASGPLVGTTTLTGDSRFSPVAGVVGSYKVTPQLGIGAGFYVSGGTRASYTNVDFSGLNAAFTQPITVKTELSILEASIGAGYEIVDGLRIGAGWRMSMVNGSLGTYAYSPGSSITGILLDSLTQTNTSGIRAGIQYAPKDSMWGVGATFRSEVDFTASGTVSGHLQSTVVGQQDLTGGAATASGIFPLAASLGAYSWLESAHKTRVILDYMFMQYQQDSQLTFTGTLKLPAALGGGTAADLSQNPLQLNWHNQNYLRIAGECFAVDGWALRLGYVYGTQVTDNSFARAATSAPGPGHVLAVGAGTTFMDKKLAVDGALEYATAAGDGTDSSASSGQPSGHYSGTAYALKVGATYTF